MISSIQSVFEDPYDLVVFYCCNCAKAMGWRNYDAKACQHCKDRSSVSSQTPFMNLAALSHCATYCFPGCSWQGESPDGGGREG
mmetsp:Transcript_45413/g.109381  ORF Transcript_45413/g.109381 Transcript_45413/m.109381 type:complete len:84 (-) Transcript_45413:53-304(-)